VYDQETSKTRRLKPATGLWKIQPQWVVTPGKQTTKTDIIDIIKSTDMRRTRYIRHDGREEEAVRNICRKNLNERIHLGDLSVGSR
jgi:hypothetical protein